VDLLLGRQKGLASVSPHVGKTVLTGAAIVGIEAPEPDVVEASVALGSLTKLVVTVPSLRVVGMSASVTWDLVAEDEPSVFVAEDVGVPELEEDATELLLLLLEAVLLMLAFKLTCSLSRKLTLAGDDWSSRGANQETRNSDKRCEAVTPHSDRLGGIDR
jgi:hypothetical protein